MKRYFIVAVVFFSIFIIACHTKAMTQSIHNPPALPAVLIDPAADLSVTGAPYDVDTMYVTDDTLSISVKYGGGCKQHVFELISNGMYSKSLPPQVGICLKHTNNEDNCRQLVMRVFKFDISKLRYAGHKTVTVKLNNKQLNYSTTYTHP